MLKLIDITKTYETGDIKVEALKGVSLEFRKNEFVAILGPSGCGKTTLLNIIGGLDHYTKGDLIINGKSTHDFTEYDWDKYRNGSVGFVFQSYNLIPHQTVLENVELALTLSGVSLAERKRRATEALNSVGLNAHLNKKPNQLSGGEMQRVAIARAIVNDPEILLADEPTGALDSETGEQILKIIKEISKDRLVIMVSHNDESANRYASRVIKIKDGSVQSDSMPYSSTDESATASRKKYTAMNFLTALKLSFKNLLSKKGRTLTTAFAGSIGIIGVALVLSMQYGLNLYMDKMTKEVMSNTPIMIAEVGITDEDAFMDRLEEAEGKVQFPSNQEIYAYRPINSADFTVNNKITQEYIDYISKMSPDIFSDISYFYGFRWNFVSYSYHEILGYNYKFFNSNALGWSELPSDERADSMYDLISDKGRYPENMNEVALIVDTYNRVDYSYLQSLGFQITQSEAEEQKSISFDDIIGKEFVWIPNNTLYSSYIDSNGNKIFNAHYSNDSSQDALKELYSSNEAFKITITGILREKNVLGGSSNWMSLYSSSNKTILYTKELGDYVRNNLYTSEIAQALREQNTDENKLKYYDILTGVDITKTKYNNQCLTYGGNITPQSLNIYPKNFETKEAIINYLNAWNKKQTEESKKIYWTDITTALDYMKEMMNTVTIVLTVFAGISLFVSSILIGVITYVSVVERTKEIGILRSIGARRKDIARVFNAETILIGFVAGIMGIVFSLLLILPINAIINNITPVPVGNIAVMNPLTAVLLIAISMLLTLISGLIPAGIAAHKDPVKALRTGE